MKYWIALFFLFQILTAEAAIYTQKDKNGNVIYSDTPLPGSTVITNTEASNYQTIPAAAIPTDSSSKQIEAVKNDYKEFSIISPANNETIQNQSVINVSVKVDPALKEEDLIQFYLDGNPLESASTNTQISINNLDRGTHQISAKLLNKKQETIKESTITIYTHRASLNQPSQQPISNPPKPITPIQN